MGHDLLDEGYRAMSSRTGLTFSQSQGLERLLQPLALGEVSEHFRLDIWNWLYYNVDLSVDDPNGKFVQDPWLGILRATHAHHWHRPLDAFNDRITTFVNTYKELIIDPKQASFNQLFDLIQFILRTARRILRTTRRFDEASPMMSVVASIFRKNMLAYDVLEISPDGPTIVPTATPEEGDAIRQAFVALATGPFDGARAHLRMAAEAINAGSAPDAIREAINAVESTIRVIAPNKNFKDAISAVDARAAIHPALREALSKLYAYTSDEKGIRHPLLESDVARVGMAEAVFMFGACASFVSYLINRGRSSGILKA
jgi:hypothetical protein